MDIYIRRGEEQFGPFTPQQVEESLASGALMETDYAWHSELTEWVPVRDSLTPAKPAAVAPPVPAAAPAVQAIEAPEGVEPDAPAEDTPASGGGRKKVLMAVAAVVILVPGVLFGLNAAGVVSIPLFGGSDEGSGGVDGPVAGLDNGGGEDNNKFANNDNQNGGSQTSANTGPVNPDGEQSGIKENPNGTTGQTNQPVVPVPPVPGPTNTIPVAPPTPPTTPETNTVVVVPPNPPTPVVPVPPAGVNPTFASVTGKLDAGGNLFLYLSTQQVHDTLNSLLDEADKMVAGVPGEGPGQPFSFKAIKGIYQETGLSGIDAIGASTKDLGGDVKRNVAVIHRNPAAGNGLLWQALGAQPHELAPLRLMPADTAFAMHHDVNVNAILAWIKKIMATAAPAEVPQFDAALELPQTKMVLDAFDGEMGLIVTLDPAKTIELPIGGAMGPDGVDEIPLPPNPDGPDTPPIQPNPDECDGPPSGLPTPALPIGQPVDAVPLPGEAPPMVKIPEPGFALVLKVKNDGIQQLLQQLIGSNGAQFVPVDIAGVNVLTLPAGVQIPAPFPVDPALFKLGNHLVLASTKALAAKIIAVHQGNAPGAAGHPEFQRLAGQMKMNGNHFVYTSPAAAKLYNDLMNQALAGVPGMVGPMEQMLAKVMSKGLSPQVAVVRAGADGFVLESHTKGVGFDAAALMGVLAGPALAAAAMGGGGDAIAGFNEPEAESMNNGRALALNFLKEDTLPPAAQWCDVLVQNGMNQRFLVEPELINPAQPNEKICTWLFNKNLGGAKLEDLADTTNTVLAFQSETTDWNGAGGQAEFANGERDAVVVVFADGHVELVSKANAEQLRWTP